VFSGIVGSACGGEKKDVGKAQVGAPQKVVEKAPSEIEAAKPATTPEKGPALLVTQSLFKADDKGQYTKPDAAVMLILKPGTSGWSAERIEDRESNVFHKAIKYGDEGILTLGGNEAMLKLWAKKDGKWQAETLWHPTFGGKHNRLRDFEIADFDGDGK